MKSSFLKAGVAVAAFALSATTAFAATSVNSTATATIVGPLSIVQNQAMSFGTFGSGSIASRVSTGGTADAGITIITPGQPASFTVTGAGPSYTLTGPTTVTLASAGSPSMTADIATPYGTRPLSSTDTFTIPGILNVAANQPSGTYTGTFTLSVHY